MWCRRNAALGTLTAPRAIVHKGRAHRDKERAMAQQRKNVMRLWLDVSKARFMVTCNPEPKIADLKSGAQKIEQESGLPMWSTELTALTGRGASVIQVTTVSQSVPVVSVGEIVVPEDLEALPW